MSLLLLLAFLTGTAALRCTMEQGYPFAYQCNEGSYCKEVYKPDGSARYHGCDLNKQCVKSGCSAWIEKDYVMCCSDTTAIPSPPPAMTRKFTTTAKSTTTSKTTTSSVATESNAPPTSAALPITSTIATVSDANLPQAAAISSASPGPSDAALVLVAAATISIASAIN
ncbi:hypothetical protein PRIPAC_97157 [Pristionchus pacificus]|uniref:Uncharacterized protein n=1 Tax=Pristionchus pacificus TaxID=54126 RepID=A0A454Y4L8_PRIPA|nr:hypothetical protein PRIPAC_97157 [Pristionchus pacificus]|eukprot:PDM60345.1 hypothetical protein PRIPAC_54170 [Pristionchus pacificus]